MFRLEPVYQGRRIPGAAGCLRVAELAESTGVTPSAIRYYARVGLLNPIRSPDNGYRWFTPEDCRRVRFIRKAQAVGLTISDIKAALALADVGELPCEQVRERVANRLAEIQRRIAELQATERRMRDALHAWDEFEAVASREDEICPLIEGLEH